MARLPPVTDLILVGAPTLRTAVSFREAEGREGFRLSFKNSGFRHSSVRRTSRSRGGVEICRR